MSQFAFALEYADERPSLPASEQPTARLEQFGAHALSDTEVLTTLLQGGGTSADSAHRLAARLLSNVGSIAKLASWTPAEFRLIGIGASKALQLSATIELGRRMLSASGTPAPILNRAELAYAYLRPICSGLTVEKFFVLSLNRKNRLIKATAVTSGTATAALAHPTVVFRQALLDGATATILAHNHPSGDPAPSAADTQITRQLREAARAIDIDLLDHIVVGAAETDPQGRGFFSFREAGLL